MSLAQDQLGLLQRTQVEGTKMCDPLFICQQLFQSFDEIQANLLGESQMWKLPKSLYLSVYNPRSLKDCLVFRE